MSASRVRVGSEIGRLERVLVHEPGPELTVVTPDNRSDYLFDDLLDLEASRREHRRFRAVLERFAEVSEVTDLLAEVFGRSEARDFLLERADQAFRQWAADAEPAELSRLMVEGKTAEVSRVGEESLALLVNEAGWLVPPLPNLLFTRDAAAVIGEAVLIAAMAHEVRWTEELIMRTLFGHHPRLRNAGFLYDGTRERRMNTSIEGGDVHVLRPDLLLLGLSERTTAAGIDSLARALFDATEVSDVLVVLMPRHRSSIHLDMIFTAIDHGLCCVYPPFFIGPTRLPVLHLSRDRQEVREVPNLFTALARVDQPMEPVYCGGERRTMQEREQWGSGCNLFAVAPGRLIAYDRNNHTLRALEREAGLRTIPGDDFLAGDAPVEEDDRFVIAIEGSELVRGGGGPRCMTLPLSREPLG